MDTTMVTLSQQETLEAHPMNGGDGINSYSQNSCYEKGIIEAAKVVIIEAVTEKLGLNNPSFDSSCNSFRIADFGCSTGPNTFLAVQNIVEAVEQKYEKSARKTPEFQVFFNDHVNNDFNILFRTLPPARKYFAAGVPGSFYSRMFPKASLHFVHSSYALHWLSKVPKEIKVEGSPAWNKGRIHYTGVEKDVLKAYFGQFQKDFDIFLKARAQELVAGGLMVIQLIGQPTGEALCSRNGPVFLHVVLGESLMDMVKMGVISEDKVDSFNLPQYYPSMEQLEMLIETDNSFTVERIGTLNHPMRNMPFDAKMTSTEIRAILEGMLKEHFGGEIMDELFELYTKKLVDSYLVFEKEIRTDFDFCLVLKRKNN
ncbi:hypothetical protein LguiB_001965 [Lonicera macranthoides]